jgi:large subunit ribosomal protein L14
MISKFSRLDVVDNSGAKLVSCIHVYSGFKKRYAITGDKILVSVKQLRSKRKSTSKVQKGEIYSALIVQTKKSIQYSNGVSRKYFNNSVILLNKQLKPVGSKIFVGIQNTFRYTKHLKILFIAPGAVI